MYKSKIFIVIGKFIDCIKRNKVNYGRRHKTAKEAKNRLRRDIDAHKIKNN